MPGAVPLEPSDDAVASATAGAYAPTTADFQCSHPDCSQLLVRPRVPVCGHPVCRCGWLGSCATELSRTMHHAQMLLMTCTAARPALRSHMLIAVRTASLGTTQLAHGAARCAVCLWGKRPLFADRCMFWVVSGS